MTDLAVEYRAPAELRDYERNARHHPPEQVLAIRRAIDEFGFTNPILLRHDRTTVGAGHGRLKAALLDPPLERVPTIVMPELSDEKWRAMVIADNRLQERSAWNLDVLKLELDALELGGFDVSLTGIEVADLSRLFAPAPLDRLEAWRGMPEFNHADKTAYRTLPIHFKDQGAVDAFAKATGLKITANTRFAWFPEIEIETYADKQYAGGAK